MNDVIKSIDWNQVGPFTAFLLLGAIIALGIAPFAFRYFGKRGEADEAERKRDFEREAQKDAALIEFVRTSSESITKIVVSSERIVSMVEASEVRILAGLRATEQSLKERIERLEKAIHDRRQEELLTAIKRDPPTKP